MASKEIETIDVAGRDLAFSKTDAKANDAKQTELSGLIETIKQRFHSSETDRQATENRWLTAYRNYRGEYDPTTLQRMDPEKSKVFVKITKTKVLAAYGQVLEVLFANKQFPISIEPSIVPDGVEELVHVSTGPQPTPSPQDRYGFAGDGKEVAPGATAATLRLNDLEGKYGQLPLQKGPSPDPNQMPELRPADEAAFNMQRVIHDQLDASNAGDELRTVLFECALLGTGVLKGPLTKERVVHTWERDPESKKIVYEGIAKLFPDVTAVSAWNLYPDPSGKTGGDCEWMIEKHALNAIQMRDLMRKPLFNKEAIRKCLQDGPDYRPNSYEMSLKDTYMDKGFESRWMVLEYWGIMDFKLAFESGLTPAAEKKYDEFDQIFINVWICGDQILRLVENPFIPARHPYHIVPYEIHPYQIWGIGVAENMDDAQMVMNGATRMAIDNLAISGNAILDVDEQSLVPGQNMNLYPGKIFRRQSGQPGQSVYGVKMPNTTNEALALFDKFRQLSDEETGMPSYSHGQTGVSGMTRTASGMSMLFGASALNIKTVIKNVDDYLLQPLGEAMFQWNMQFNEDEDLPVRGDIEVRARGTSALMQKEVRSQRLMTLMQISTNQFLAPLVKWPELLKEVAITLDIDPEKLINDPAQAAVYARIIGLTQPGSGGAGPGMGVASTGALAGVGAAGGSPAGASVQDTQGSGGGNVGTGSAPMPGSPGFSANNT